MTYLQFFQSTVYQNCSRGWGGEVASLKVGRKCILSHGTLVRCSRSSSGTKLDDMCVGGVNAESIEIGGVALATIRLSSD